MAEVTQADYNAMGFDWHECNNLHLHADDMQTNTEAGDPNPQHYMLDNIYCLGDPTIQECLDVSRLNKRPLRMSLVRNTTDEVGTCADDPLHAEIRDLMYEYYDDMEWLVNDEWHQGGAYNNQALALDELLRLPVDPVASPDFLEPAFALDMWTFTTLYSAFPASPLRVRSMPVNCEKSIEYKLKQALEPVLQKRMLELLSQVPTPHHFDVDGLTTWPVSLEETERFQSGQNVRIYGDLSH